MKSISSLLIGITAIAFFISTKAYTQNNIDSLNISVQYSKDSIPESDNQDVYIEYEITSEGDTIYHYKYKPYDYGKIYTNQSPRLNNKHFERASKNLSEKESLKAILQNTKGVVQTKYTGKIPYSENITPSGGRTYSIPIQTVPVCSFVPQVALSYNSQTSEGVAGYGWNIAGVSAITVTSKNSYYDNVVAPIDLSAPSTCAYSLDGIRLVYNETAPVSDYYYETAQGMILVQKHTFGSIISHFTALYPNGTKATFGYADNRDVKHSYPLTEITDVNGYRIDFKYFQSGNNYYLSKISYGGKTPDTHQAEIEFNYVDRNDFTVRYIAATAISANKLLRSIVSKSKTTGTLKELYTYSLTHEEKDFNRLIRLDCSSGSSNLNPLQFTYNDKNDNTPGYLTNLYSHFISEYFSSQSDAKPLYIRGKFIKNKFNDGLITYPGKFSTYTKTGDRVKTFLWKKKRYAFYGSGYPADQNIIIVPGISFLSSTKTIKTEEGFQTIQAVDVNGDGKDEIVKVNFDKLSGNNTILKITIYSVADSDITSRSFTVPVIGVVDNQGQTTSPMSRVYFFGDFQGTGKAQLLTISHNKAFTGEDKTSYAALIDLDGQNKLSEASLFSLGFSDANYIYPLDINADGKTELCYATSSGLEVYSLSGNYFTKLFTAANLKRNSLSNTTIIGDLNSDGKPDFLVAPNASYQDIQWREIPIWSPTNCPFCHNSEPIENIYDTKCRHCHQDIKEYYINNTYEAKCRECGSVLQNCGNGSFDDPSYPNNPGHNIDDVSNLCCFNHGSIANVEINYGYVDNGNAWTAYLSTGKGFIRTTQHIVNKEYWDDYYLMDVNNDGNADLLRVKDKRVDLYLNKNGVIQSKVTSSNSVPTKTKILPVNVCDMHNISHFITIENAEVKCYKFTKDFAESNLLTKFIDSHGIIHYNQYSNMAETSSGYVSTDPYLFYPYSSFIAPLYLLEYSSVFKDDMYSSPINNYHYTYYDAVIHRKGLGFCGFTKRIIRDEITKTTTETTYDPKNLGVVTMEDSPYKTMYISYNYDNFDNKKNNPKISYSSETNKLTQTYFYTQYEYDSYNNPIKVTQNIGGTKLSNETTQTYDNIVNSERYLLGQPRTKTVKTSRDGASWITKEEIAYNSNRLPVSKTTYTGVHGNNKTETVVWEYDAGGKVTSEKSAPYNVSALLGNTYEYDTRGRLTKTTDALGHATEYFEFDKFGNPQKVRDHHGRITKYDYDEWGQLTTVTHPDGIIEHTQTAWGGEGLYTVTQTRTGKTSVITHYDALGREIRTANQRFDGSWQYVDKVYDTRGRVEKISLPFKGSSATLWNTYSYDEYDRPTRYNEASGKTTTWTYDGLSVTETRNGMATTKTTDASGALIKVEDPGGIITYSLRADGQPASITAPGNIVTSFTYDDYGRQTSISDPSAGKQTFNEKYETNGTLTTTVTDARGKVIKSVYDKFGKLESVTRPEFSTSYEYNDDGLLTDEISTNGTKKEFAYDDLGRIESIKETAPDAKFLQKNYTYSNGNVATVKYTAHTGEIATEHFVYAYGHNTEIKLNNATSIWKMTEENALGQPTKAVTGGMTCTYGYNAHGIPTSRTVGNLQNFTFSFDVQKGNLLSRKDNKHNKTETFGYDNLNRLSAIGSQTITYADNGNITKMPDVGDFEYHTPDKPYAISQVNLAHEAIPVRTQELTYTSFQRPETITENGIKATFAYNAGGERAKMHVTQANNDLLTRYYIGGQYELDAQTNTERLYLGGDAYSAPAVFVKENTDSWKIYYLCRDYLGSITHIANSDGSLKQELSYDAWGRLRNPATQVAYAPGSEPTLFLGRGYTGHEHLPWFGLINMNARLYDAVLGRFLSPDPYVQLPDFTQNFNRYSYCLNNPLVYIDPSGEWAIIDDIIGALFGGVINWVGYGCQFNWKGLSYFGVGLVGGWASLYMSPAGGGALMSGMNSVVNQGFGADGKWNWNNIKLDGILFDTAIGGATAGIGSKISGKLSPYISKYTSKLGGKAVQEMTTQGLTSSATGFMLSTGTSLLEGDDIETALGKGWGGAKNGWISGSIGGLGHGLRQAYKAGENPWTGRKYLSNEVISNFQKHAFSKNRHDDLGLTEREIINNLEDFVVRNRLNIKAGSNTFQGNINGIQKSIIINVNEGRIRSLNMYPGYSNRRTRNPIINFGKIKW